MCTVSVISTALGFRLVTSRDESRGRAPGLAPAWREHGGVPHARVLMPVDPKAGGTWVGAAEHGLALALLNCNPEHPPELPAAERRLSRGTIIPGLIACADATLVIAGVDGLELERLPPFRLVAVDRPEADGPARVGVARWDGRSLTRVWLGAPACLASSGLGDHVVDVRLPLFEEMVGARAGDDAEVRAAQDAFHHHAWPERRHVSVLMSRPEARTVSITSIDVARPSGGGGERWGVRAAYEPVPEGVAGGDEVHSGPHTEAKPSPSYAV
ncbi:MAG: NRDE family protein [Phycisphaerales bacterium]|nr:NRDE family protein [Phycisphaerales bacterium]